MIDMCERDERTSSQIALTQHERIGRQVGSLFSFSATQDPRNVEQFPIGEG